MVRQPQAVTNPRSPERLLRVSADSLVPCEVPTSARLLRSADCYQRYCLKHPFLSSFHSYPEFLHGILLDIDPDVTRFVPQPFRLRAGSTWYIPDCYVIRNGQPEVVELKARGGMDETLKRSVTAFLASRDLPFRVIANDAILEREAEALHWLPLLQVINSANEANLVTDNEEWALEQAWMALEAPTVGDLLDLGQRDQQAHREVALYRLLYRHRLSVDLSRRPFDLATELYPCA